MARSSTMTTIAMAALAAALAAFPAAAKTVSVPAGAAKTLQMFLDLARPGDVLRLAPGEHRGPVTISTTVTVEGEPGAEIVGNGKGSVVIVTAPGAVVRGVTVRGSGTNIPTLDSGIFLDRTAKGAVAENNEVIGNLYGIYIQGADDALVKDNRIEGISEGRSAEAGNGVHLWNAPGAKVIGNDISKGRDGIATMASKHNVFSGNRFSNMRFAIHYMYTNDSEISGNVSTGNSVGYAIMFSDRLTVTRNISNGDRDHGLLLNTSKGSRVTGNIVVGRMQPVARWTMAGRRGDSHGVPMGDGAAVVDASGMRLGPEKCVFIYNANRNAFHDNWFENCAIGIHFTAGSEGNRMSGNTFVNNRNQVKYVGTRHLDWSVDGRGNFWSDNPAFDLNGDGIGDSPYRPNDLVDRVLWTAPQAKILVNSPAVQVIRWAQSQFPAILPGGVVDSHPLMAPPPLQSRSRSQLQ
ncbi:MAG: nitrous oxide reductase family maturation protein NosD [Aquamicrobium sp.]|uniref:nitrous oxide reductase family maturation protein NosD n=1 Tax=Aquamicrobium sp. TaxID=1872579 RepID=UPI00349E5AC8|nr:nitrous oxide reductase family maturation protein NosD [Aquamicrobium sp.]